MSTHVAYDPILLEIMNNEFGAVADEMSFTLRRSGRSFAAHEGGDSMVGVLDRDGQLVVRGRFGLGAWYVPMAMPWVLEKYQEKFQQGDIVISNDPYSGGSHLNDIVLIMPVFWEEELVAFTGCALHHPDVGGRAPGNMSPFSAEVYEEGLRLPPVLLHAAGVPNAPLLEVIEANSRAGAELLGDLEAKITACRRGEEGVFRLIRKYGLDSVAAYGQYLIDYTVQQLRAGIDELPDGEWFGEMQLDDDGAGGPGPIIVQRLQIQGDSLTIDYTGTGPQVGTAINMPPQMTMMRIVEPLRHVLNLDVPVNSGLWNLVNVIAPEGTILNPRFPAAVGARSLTGIAQRDLLLAALAAVAPERVPAADSGPPGIMVYTSRTSGATPKVLFDLYKNGSGGRPTGDGEDGSGGNSAGGGGLYGTPVEVIEREHPVLYEGFGFAPDTGGAGKFRGAVSVFRSWRFLEDGTVHVRNFHFDQVPSGAAGGRNGTRPRVTLESGGKTVELPAQSHIEINVRSGDVLTHVFAGAGGHGNPRERDPRRVLDDVLDEKITIAYAAREFGVVIDAQSMQINERLTAMLRQEEEPSGDASDDSTAMRERKFDGVIRTTGHEGDYVVGEKAQGR